MYCNIEEVIRICLILKEGEAMDPDDDDDDDDDDNNNKKIKITYEKVLANT
jgi:hypothetical protein